MSVYTLLVVYQLKHFLADYPLQPTKLAAKKFLPGWDFLPGLAAHAWVHATFTLAIVCAAGRRDLWWLSWVDFVVHGTMDRIKAAPQYLGRFKALSGAEYRAVMSYRDTVGIDHSKLNSNTYFWWALGFDQMVHHLTHYFIIWMVLQ